MRSLLIKHVIKWAYFIAYTEDILIKDIVQIYIREVFIKYKVLDKIILNRDIRFLVVF